MADAIKIQYLDENGNLQVIESEADGYALPVRIT
jgi:hypothetical protein